MELEKQQRFQCLLGYINLIVDSLKSWEKQILSKFVKYLVFALKLIHSMKILQFYSILNYLAHLKGYKDDNLKKKSKNTVLW